MLVCLCCWKNRLRYQKTAVLGWGKHLLFFSSTLVQYVIIYIFCFTRFSSKYKSLQTLHWFCVSFIIVIVLFVSQKLLFISIALRRKIIAMLVRFFSVLYGNYYSFFLCVSTLLSFCVCLLSLQRKLTTWNTCLFLFCVCFSLLIAINTTSFGFTYICQSTQSHFILFCNVNIAN